MENSKITRSMVSLETMESEWVGRGVSTYVNGDVYDGEWIDDKRHGKFGDYGE